MSQVWYSSEVAGTIMVQCIPILRPILRNIHTSFTSRKLESSTGERKGSGWTWTRSSKHISTGPLPVVANNNPDGMELRNIPEENEPQEFDFWDKNRVPSPDIEEARAPPDHKFTRDDSWPLGPASESGKSTRSFDMMHPGVGLAVEQEGYAQQGLSPPPPRRN
jgi:hypothetical protein